MQGPATLLCAILAALAVTGTAAARKIQFGVVAFPKSTVEVEVNGNRYRMSPPDMYAPYYWGNFDVPDSFTYKYVVDGVAEGFQRPSPDSSRAKTYNDLYGRAKSVVKLPNLPQPFDDGWSRGIGFTPLLDPSYIPTVHLTGDPTRINDVWTNMRANNTANVTMTVVMADYVKRFENVRYAISAAGRSQNYAKQAYRLKLDSGDDLFGRNEFKLRIQEEDPLQMREVIYQRMLLAAGCPVIHSNHIRLYVNKEPVGLFAMGDDANQPSTIKALFHGTPQTIAPNQNKQIGPIFEANSFIFTETSVQVGNLNVKPLNGDVSNILKMTAAVRAIQGDSGFDALNQVMDLELFMRAHAFEYLAFHWDSSWMMGSNYMMYDDRYVAKKIWYSDEDFDMTMGCSASAGGATRNAPYEGYETFGSAMNDSKNALIPKILSSPTQSARFKTIVTTIVQHLFNPTVMEPYIRALHARIADDVAWDRATPRRQNGKPDNWVIQDFYTNLQSPVKFAEFGLLEWFQMRAAGVQKLYGVQWDATPKPAPDPRVTPPPSDLGITKSTVKTGLNSDKVATQSPGSQTREFYPILFAAALFAVSLGYVWL